jgi:tetratricopeptide (TPR) repeat protein
MANTPDELVALGYQARREKRLQDAKNLFSESVALSRQTDDQPALASSLVGLGQIEHDLNNLRAAAQHYQEAVDIYRSESNPGKLAHTIRHVGDILREEGSLTASESCYEEALAIYRKDNATSSLDLANAIRGFALLKSALGEAQQAKSLWQEARNLYESVNVQPGVRESDAQIARLTAH